MIKNRVAGTLVCVLLWMMFSSSTGLGDDSEPVLAWKFKTDG